MANKWRNNGNSGRLYFGGSKIYEDGDCSYEIERCLLLARKVITNLDSVLKSRDITLPTKAHLVKAIFFSSGHVWMWELDYKDNWVLKNWCFWTVMLEKSIESPLDCKDIQPDHPKGNQSWMFTKKADVEAETPILWPPDVKCWLIWRDPIAGKDWRQEEKGMTEDEMIGWHHWLNTWVWVNSWSWWWTGKLGMWQFMGSINYLKKIHWAQRLNDNNHISWYTV